ncbi:tRNA pseudouridine(38-40) synthase TruA [Thermodesulfobacteriota bacterium]
MLKNFKLTIEYDGGRYHGWQRQKNERTIQCEIESALKKMIKQPVSLTGSGRTDAGVHAMGQTANFCCETGLSSEVFFRGLNSLLPSDIVIQACEQVSDSFHARFDAISKTYRYRIFNRMTPTAVGRQYAWFIRQPLDADAMRGAMAHIIGTYDFKAFEGVGSPRAHTIRQVMTATLFTEDQDVMVFEIEANGFLRFMVRNIVGALVDVGKQRITPDDFLQIRNSRDRNLCSATAPPHGLFLVRVTY